MSVAMAAKKHPPKSKPTERVVPTIRELRLKFKERNRPLVEYIEREAQVTHREFTAMALTMLEYAAAQMSAHDLESTKAEK